MGGAHRERSRGLLRERRWLACRCGQCCVGTGPGNPGLVVSVTVTLSRAALTLAPSALHFEEPPQSSRTLATYPDQVWRRPQKCTRSHLYSHLSSEFINGPCTTYL